MEVLCRFTGKVSDICEKIGAVLSVVLMLLLFISIIIGVISRSFTDWGLLWPEEVSRFSVVAGAFIGGSVAMKKAELTRFDFFLNIGHRRGGTFYRTIICVVELFFVVCFTYCGFQALPAYSMFRAVGLPITLAVPAAGMVLGGIFMIVHLVYQLFCQINCLLTGQSDIPEKREV